MLLGDQVYADETSERDARLHPRPARHEPPPGEQVADFEEYAQLYREAWSDPDIRWLLATVPSTMIFDDHDVHDDWNISEAWVREHARDVVVGRAHHGRVHVVLALPAHRQSGPARTGRGAPARGALRGRDDGGPRLREFARAVDREPAASRFAFHRDFGRSRLVVIDSRAARVLAEGRRDMVDDEEWQWIAEHARGAFDHLIIASTLPVFMTPGIDGLEAWNEAVCSGAWGRLAARAGEKLRRALDLEHWPAFQRSFTDDGRAPARARRGPGRARARSPDRRRRPHGLRRRGRARRRGRRAASSRSSARRSGTRSQPRERRVIRLCSTRAAGVVARALARSAGVRRPDASWRLVSPLTFDNSIAVLELDERARAADDPAQRRRGRRRLAARVAATSATSRPSRVPT